MRDWKDLRARARSFTYRPWKSFSTFDDSISVGEIAGDEEVHVIVFAWTDLDLDTGEDDSLLDEDDCPVDAVDESPVDAEDDSPVDAVFNSSMDDILLDNLKRLFQEECDEKKNLAREYKDR